MIRIRLSQTFRYIISQRLIPRADRQGRIAAIEILRSTQRTRDYVERGEQSGSRTLTDAMKDGAIDGMQTFDQVLEDMVRSGVITIQDGVSYSSNPGNFSLAISDMTSNMTTQEAVAPPTPTNSGSFPAVDGFER